MITGVSGAIRTADLDDAAAIVEIANPPVARSIFFDVRREVQTPTFNDICEMLRSKELKRTPMYIVENEGGEVRGLFLLKGSNQSAFYSELVCAFIEPEDYRSPMAEEALEMIKHMAFVDHARHKILAQCLDCEEDFRGLLLHSGFALDGFQRQAVFARGRYNNLETYSLFRVQYEEQAAGAPGTGA